MKTNIMFDIPNKEDKETQIHPTALVSKSANIGVGVKVGPFALVGDNVELGDFVNIGSHCIVEGKTTIGEQTIVYSMATLGSKPQDLKYNNEDTILHVGKRNSIRQYANMSIGTADGGGKTIVGDDNLFMVNSHVGHDAKIQNKNVIANGVSLAGHVSVASNTIIGGHVAIHQFCKIGDLSLAAGGAIITKDVAPFCIVHGNRAEVNGINIIGLKRNGYNTSDLAIIKQMYKLTFVSDITLAEAVSVIETQAAESELKTIFLDFIKTSERGLCRK